MEEIAKMSGAPFDAAELVKAARDGSRDAYGQIVARYQALICALAYSGTGSFTRSEDIAQETFITGWKQLCELRDPTNLRAWLCGIARNLISNAHRRSIREPAEVGESLDAIREVASAESSPPEQAIREEEEAILWGALGSIPDNYREPLILYYRRHRSVAQVAQELGLSEDATKQRLSRGRALLQEQVMVFIEGTLERTRPGPVFTNAVMSALPVLAPAVAGAMASPTANASTATKAASSASGAGFNVAMMGLFAGLAGYIGWQMRDSIAQSPEERRSVHRFWRFVVIGFAAFIVPTFLFLIIWGLVWGHSQPWLRTGLTWWLGAVYVVVTAPLAVWAWQNHVRVRGCQSANGRQKFPTKFVVTWVALLLIGVVGIVAFGFPSGHWTDLWLEVVFVLVAMPLAAWGCEWVQRRQKREPKNQNEIDQVRAAKVSLRWVAVATICMAVLLVFTVYDMGWWRSKNITARAARDLLVTRRDAQVFVLEYQNGEKLLCLEVPWKENPTGKPASYFAAFDESTLLALKTTGAPYKTFKQGQDFEIFGWPGRMLFLLSFMVVIAGIVVLALGFRNKKRPAFSPLATL